MARGIYFGMDSAKIAVLITAYEGAILALASAQEYKLEGGGQMRMVRKTDLPSLENTLQELYAARDYKASGSKRATFTLAQIQR